MTIWGRLIGAIFGYKLLGILGGVLGFVVGSWFDRGLRLHLYHFPRARTLAVQQAFFRATFSVMGHLAKADGRVSEDEIRAAENIMSRLELNDELRREAIRLFNSGKEPDFDLNQTLIFLLDECRKYPDLLRFFIEIQLEAALADGELRPQEREILLLICEKLHFSPQEFEQLWARQWASQAFHQWFSSQFDPNRRSYGEHYHYYNHSGGGARRSAYANSATDSSEDAYGVLGISSTATPAEIKKAYRRLMNQHHPDKLAARGLPEGMVKLAKEKTQQIRAAYDLIRKERGFR